MARDDVDGRGQTKGRGSSANARSDDDCWGAAQGQTRQACGNVSAAHTNPTFRVAVRKHLTAVLPRPLPALRDDSRVLALRVLRRSELSPARSTALTR
jgi:hypothetical protein